MSLNKTLDRLFDEIRREARRNPEFADRLDAVLRGHASRRDVAEDTIEEVLAAPPLAEAGAVIESAPEPTKPPSKAAPKPAAPKAPAANAFNPVGIYLRDGEDALLAALDEQGLQALQALVREHNLDPGGVADGLDREALAAHVVSQARRRAERDKKLFDY